MAAANSDEILHDLSPLLRHYKDGRVERMLGSAFIQPSFDPETGVQSKDVEISAGINLSARLYLPKNASPAEKLPILLYFHGGGFVIESAFSELYQNHLNHLVAEANVVAVSVNYRLAPEHPVPAAFEDSWLALEWIATQFREEGREEWIKQHADANRVFLGGDSAGGTIAHYVALRAGIDKLKGGITLRGAFLNCPYFWGELPIADEMNHPHYSKSFLDTLWKYASPSSSQGSDDPLINPEKDPRIARLGCKRLLVHVAEKDVLRARGLLYKDILKKNGWDGEIEVVDVEGEVHVFSVFTPTSETGVAMIKKVASFINAE
ncbi:2-hydroxyisoflavanone dehydratase-like [Dorcoceras hygrometricum]|uniref:2-hydroxyisoflavanone dehydratase-like n=1 Tax=Dorcoceras hygrometricum TaxID=472368 RepID=A0A2Z7C3T7_9LAMI|nr:2-hydroxyisoflavanone dehydratase-like [Dorcoceras hygrometricum]